MKMSLVRCLLAESEFGSDNAPPPSTPPSPPPSEGEHEEHGADEGEEDGAAVLEAWMDRNDISQFEGDPDGLIQLIVSLGYGDITEFLRDNSGAQGAIAEFISDQLDANPEWKESLSAE